MRDRPQATREEQNQIMLDRFLKDGLKVTLEQVSDNRTLHDIAFNSYKYK